MSPARGTTIDHVGLGWRRELSVGIHLALDRIDTLEVIADNWFDASRRDLAALASLAREVPVWLHGVGMGLASASPVDRRRVDAMARLFEHVRPAGWSEHLAMVRADGVEIGHLTAPPRSAATIDGTVANVAFAARTVGVLPLLENIASILTPPASTMTESAWIAAIVERAGAPLLLDLHNLFANATNAGRDPSEDLAALPIERVRVLHLSGGHPVDRPGGRRLLLDDHLHDPPAEVYSLLERAAARLPAGVSAIVERDGRYPPMATLLAQLDRAREALSRGRGEPAARARAA